ncbi:UNKNOWN [Stylonychia lemnae]|uniref:Uncharacterized protein n=1 Tax=Stylonychia lemnae TaxID=5949 RepID=A0A077ZV83_STYLE|nr:UNKNOWN [Stylonychia lemnae]|eukprot:CDW73215.1 UNKNOWN [Stylonychia lemnae]
MNDMQDRIKSRRSRYLPILEKNLQLNSSKSIIDSKVIYNSAQKSNMPFVDTYLLLNKIEGPNQFIQEQESQKSGPVQKTWTVDYLKIKRKNQDSQTNSPVKERYDKLYDNQMKMNQQKKYARYEMETKIHTDQVNQMQRSDQAKRIQHYQFTLTKITMHKSIMEISQDKSCTDNLNPVGSITHKNPGIWGHQTPRCLKINHSTCQLQTKMEDIVQQIKNKILLNKMRDEQ